MGTKSIHLRHLLGLFLLSLILSIGCSKDETAPPEDMPPESDPCENVTASYMDDIRPIIDASCAISGCHVEGGQGSGIFETFEGVKEKADNGSLLIRAVTQANMPPSSSSAPVPTSSERNLIRCWIEAGAMMN